MRSHSVTCHPAQVTFPPSPQHELVLDLAIQEGCKAELTWVVVTSQDSLPAKDGHLSQCHGWDIKQPNTVCYCEVLCVQLLTTPLEWLRAVDYQPTNTKDSTGENTDTKQIWMVATSGSTRRPHCRAPVMHSTLSRRNKSATLISTITLPFLSRFLYFYTIGNRNEYSTIM